MTRKRLIMHVGLPKCGSTSLQFILRSNEARLCEHGIFYPPDLRQDDIARSSGEHRLAHMAIVKDLVAPIVEGEEAPGAALRAVTDAFAKSSCATMILSSESLAMRAGRIKRSAMERLSAFDVEIVVFIRRRDEWLRSFYKQIVKSRRSRYAGTFDDFLAESSPRAKLAVGLDLSSTLQRLARLSAARTVHVFDLDKERDRTQSLMSRIVGLPIERWDGDPTLLSDGNRALVERGLPVNASISDAAALFLRRFNELTAAVDAADGPDHDAVVAALLIADVEGCLPACDLMTPALSRALLAEGRDDRRRLIRRFGADLADATPLRDSGRPQTLRPGEWAAIADAVAARIDPAARDRFVAVVRRRGELQAKTRTVAASDGSASSGSNVHPRGPSISIGR